MTDRFTLWQLSFLLRQWAIQRADEEDPFMGYGVLEEERP